MGICTRLNCNCGDEQLKQSMMGENLTYSAYEYYMFRRQ